MKSWKIMLGATAAALTFGSAAMAQTAPAPAAPAPAAAPAAPAPAYTFAFNAAYTSDYIFRGLSQTGGKGAASVGVDFTAGLFYLGNWDSNVDFGPTAGDPADKTTFEYDLYGGFRPTVGPVVLDLGFIRYGYVNEPNSAHYTYYEGKAGASYASGPNTLSGVFYYSPEFFGKTGSAEYYEIDDSFTLSNKASISGGVGYQALDKDKAGISGYTQWNVGVGYPITDHFGIDLRYFGTDNSATDFYTRSFAGQRLVATLKATF
jgi:uncharacterized protein (TIGR02001 family)